VSTKLGAGGGMHDIDVKHTAAELERIVHGRFTHPVDWPQLWHSGDSVAILTTDRKRYLGVVLDVSYVTKSVLIELNPIG
jgi:hypothetical protein